MQDGVAETEIDYYCEELTFSKFADRAFLKKPFFEFIRHMLGLPTHAQRIREFLAQAAA